MDRKGSIPNQLFWDHCFLRAFLTGGDLGEGQRGIATPGLRPWLNLADHRLLEVTSGGELILAGGTGNGYRLAELMGATNPSGWSGVLKVKTPVGATVGYILLHSNP